MTVTHNKTSRRVLGAVLALANGAAAAAVWAAADKLSVQTVGLPFSVIAFSAVGSLFALAYSEPIRPWWRLVSRLAVHSVVGCVAALVTPAVPKDWPLIGWVALVPQPAVAFFVGMAALWVIPQLIKRADQISGERKNG